MSWIKATAKAAGEMPTKASDAGPLPQTESRDPLTLVGLAEEYLNIYRKNKREALRTTPRTNWLCPLREAIRLLDKAETCEIDEPAYREPVEDREL